jgi:hypothetical protein
VSRAGRLPDLILSAHVMNYQRFTRQIDGNHVPYVISGAGGYYNLHRMARSSDGTPLVVPWQPEGADVVLEAYHDASHGFLRVDVTPERLTGTYTAVTRSGDEREIHVVDTFNIALHSARV